MKQKRPPSCRPTIGRLLYTWYLNTHNSLVFLFSWGHCVLHEGRFRRRTWYDWARAVSCRPQRYEQPTTEEELCNLIRQARKVRVVGGGHSFNTAVVSEETLLSLDRLKNVTLRPHPDKPGWKIASAQAGIRLRDFTRILAQEGVAITVAGSTDAQSLGGLIATDVHGTGRDHGFLSESILSLRMVDAQGNVGTFYPGDDVFHAAIGGAGLCGVVAEADIECEPAFNLAKAVKVVDRDWAEANIDQLLAENSHLSFYYFGGFARRSSQETITGLSKVRMNKWNRTIDPPNKLLTIYTLEAELSDMLFSGFLFDLARLLHIANPVARVALWFYGFMVNSRELVYPSHRGFPRTLYFRHDEIEYGIPFERYQECLLEVRNLLLERGFPMIIEVRFTPNKSQALLGPGSGRDTVYLELAPSMSRPTDPIFAEFEKIVIRFGGRVHLGKKTYITPKGLAQMYPAEVLQRFESARLAQDPHGKFMNEFTERLFGAPTEERRIE